MSGRWFEKERDVDDPGGAALGPKRYIREPQRLLLVVILSLAVFAGQACNSDADEPNADSAVLLAVTTLDSMNYHAMANAIEGGIVPPDAESKTSRGLAVVRMTGWPTELEQAAKSTEDVLADLLAELTRPDRDDTLHAAEAAGKVHDVQHSLSSLAWGYLEQRNDVVGLGPATASHD